MLRTVYVVTQKDNNLLLGVHWTRKSAEASAQRLRGYGNLEPVVSEEKMFDYQEEG